MKGNAKLSEDSKQAIATLKDWRVELLDMIKKKEESIINLRKLAKSVTAKTLAEDFNVSVGTIHRI